MKAARIHSFGGPEALAIEEAPQPAVSAPDDVLVRVQAAGVNPIDWLFRNGYGKDMFHHQLPLTLGCDVTGIVETIGASVNRFKVGDAVFGYLNLERNGAFAEFALAKEEELGRKPASLDFVQAAGVPVVFLTAFQSIFDLADLHSGQRLLVHGAAGGVGSSAVQLGKWKGVYVIGTASARNLDLVRQFGADEVIDYQTTPFEEAASEIDVVLDTIGGDTQERSWKVLKRGGTLVSTIQPPSAERAAEFGVQAKFVNVVPNGKRLETLGQLFDSGVLRIQVEAVFPLAEAGKALQLSESKRARGKIVLQMRE
jgi:NADPH:quinone reductase-like Zn-dependent oxidoreductase